MMENVEIGAPLLGGVLVGLAASWLLLGNGRVAGIAGILAGLLRPAAGETGWRLAFVAGLLAGGAVLAVLHPAALEVRAPVSRPFLALAGLLVGYGTRLGNGCTSGHGVCGVSRLAPRSLVATATFLATGAMTVALLHPVLGGTQ